MSRTTFVPLLALALVLQPMLASAQTYRFNARVPDLRVTVPSPPAPGGELPATNAPAASLSTSTLSFGSVIVGQSAKQSVVLTNSGNAAMTLTVAPTLTGASVFSSSTTCGSTLAAGASCTVEVTFAPQTSGARSASLSFSTNAAGSPHVVSISGTGALAAAPVATLSVTSLAFGSVPVGSSSQQTATLTNSGTATMTLSAAPAVSGDAAFSSTSTCGSSLAAGESCTATVTFAPQTSGARSGTLAFTTNAAGSPHAVSLTGTGSALPAPVASLSTASMNFGDVTAGTSAQQSVVLTNVGNATMTLTAAPLLTGAADYSASTTCGASLDAGASCSVQVTFAPTDTAGTRSASLAFATNATGSPHTVSITGNNLQTTGVLTANTSSDFGIFTLGGSASRTFTFRNSGTLTAYGVYATLPTPAGLTVSSNTCGTAAQPVSLAPNASCAFTLTYAPTEVGNLAGNSIGVSALVSNGPFTMPLYGEARFNSLGIWSSQAGYNTTPTGQFGTLFAGQAKSLTYYVRNHASYGNFRMGLALSGSTTDYRITSVVKSDSSGTTAACGAVIASDGLSLTSPCVTEDVHTANSKAHVQVTVRYEPTGAGTHAALLTPTDASNAYVQVPAALSLTGTQSPATTTMLLHGEGALTDVMGHTVNTSTSIAYSSTNVLAGTRSLEFNGTSSVLAYNAGSNGDFTFGTGDFTLEAWVRITSYSEGTYGRAILDLRPNATNGAYPTLLTLPTGEIAVMSNATTLASASTKMPLNTWAHVAWSRVDGVSYLFMNGVLQASFADTRSYQAGSTIKVGSNAFFASAPSTAFKGQLDEVRITKGGGRYSADFTPDAGGFSN